MTIRRHVLIGATLLLLAGCGGRYLPVDDAGRRTALPAPGAVTPPVSPDGLPLAPIPLAALHDTCGATELQYLVGKPETQIPVPVDPGQRQVTCAGCVMGPGSDPTRTTILFDQGSGLVTQVMCR
jgi:hypothetical protein